MSSLKNIKSYVRRHHRACQPSSVNHSWVIGLTNDPKRRIGEHKTLIKHEPRHWRIFVCDSYFDALALEKYFKDIGYNVGTGGTSTDSINLYMYYLPHYKHLKRKATLQ